MKVTKVSLDSGKLYEIFMKDDPESHPTRLAYYIEEMDMEKSLKFGGDNEAAYHRVMEGTGSYVKDLEAPVSVSAGSEIYCELENTMEIWGQGRLLSMVMEKSIHGTARMIELEGEQVLKVGEVIGENCMALTGIDGVFELICQDQSYPCEKGSMIIVHMAKKEFAKIALKSDENVRISVFNCVKMFDSDFSKHMGLYVIAQSTGYCKVRLDVKKEHMNPIGSVHGGALFTMADEACGIAASTTGGICTTVDSHIEFLNAAIGVEYLTAEAKPKKIGKKIRSFIVEIKDEKDRLIATADFIFFCLQS